MIKPPTQRWVVMGVSGCGKSAIGQLLAHTLGVPFVEGDAWHPAANVAKMAAGIALTDADRAGWLAALRDQLGSARAGAAPLVLSCSALKRRYRDLLRQGDPQLVCVELSGPPALIAARMAARSGHFMPTSLLASQWRDFEPLQADERGVRVDIAQAPAAIVQAILAASAQLA